MADELTKKRVAAFTIAIGRALGRSDQEIRITARAALLRNVDGDSIPFADASEIIAAQHESYDGTGFPKGLKEGEIPLGARILKVADALEALLTGRPPLGDKVVPWEQGKRHHHRAVSIAEAQKQLQSASGTAFDPTIVNIVLGMPDGIWADLIQQLPDLTDPQ